MNEVHFSSKTAEWETPQDLFDELDEYFCFDLDVCATPENENLRLIFEDKKLVKAEVIG